MGRGGREGRGGRKGGREEGGREEGRGVFNYEFVSNVMVIQSAPKSARLSSSHLP